MKFFHTAISVKSLIESQKFYEEVFDFKFKVKGERPELGVKFVMLENNQEVVIELFKHNNPKPIKEDLMDFQQMGFKHIAFIVDNIEEVMRKASKFGVRIYWAPKKGITIKRLAFISDPNGIPIELAEV
jgi:glyoxylase I family protein